MNMDFEVIWTLVLNFFISTKLYVILAMVGIDVVLAVAVALRTKTFDFAKLADFLTTMILPYILAYLALHIIIGLVTELQSILGQGLDTAVFLVIIVTLLAAITDNLKALGLPLPNVRQANAVKDQ